MSDMKTGAWALVRDNCPMRMRVDDESVEVYFEEGFEIMFTHHALARFIALADEALHPREESPSR